MEDHLTLAVHTTIQANPWTARFDLHCLAMCLALLYILNGAAMLCPPDHLLPRAHNVDVLISRDDGLTLGTKRDGQ
jgi:hypothetical protein